MDFSSCESIHWTVFDLDMPPVMIKCFCSSFRDAAYNKYFLLLWCIDPMWNYWWICSQYCFISNIGVYIGHHKCYTKFQSCRDSRFQECISHWIMLSTWNKCRRTMWCDWKLHNLRKRFLLYKLLAFFLVSGDPTWVIISNYYFCLEKDHVGCDIV